METNGSLSILQEAERRSSLAELLHKLEENCQNCRNSTPIICVGTCKTWKLKNQLRNFYQRTRTHDFMTRLLNTLKNKRRTRILEALSKEKQSAFQLQQKLKKEGFNHSEQTIIEEYIKPLINVGLIEENRHLYSATLFGREVGALMGFRNIGDVLPPHSECYEETILDILKDGPKTSLELSTVVPQRSLTRVLNRLRKEALIETSINKDYIFFFKTKRDPKLEKPSPTEIRVYENIPEQGISARKLAINVGITLRRTYKYLRKLKGKKLVFVRKKPLTYKPTAKGREMTNVLECLRKLVIEVETIAAGIVNSDLIIDRSRNKNGYGKIDKVITLATIQHIKRN